VPYFPHAWQIVHASERVQIVSPTAFALPLSNGSGALIGHGTFSGNGVWGGIGQVTDSTTIDIYHTPPGS
jgi:hypothetical protein